MRYLNFMIMFFSIASFASIYQWQDEQGVVHFSDQLHVDAKKITLPANQNLIVSAQQTTAIKEVADKFAYQQFAIIEPTNQATVHNNAGIITVRLQLQPALRVGDKVELFLDGKLLAAAAVMEFQLSNVNRGEHSLIAKVIDGKGNMISLSAATVFYLRKSVTTGYAAAFQPR